MKTKKIILITWLTVNLILLGKYIFDMYTIHCEPCLSGQDCPPCRTDYMKNIWWFLLIWNLVSLVAWAFFRKK